jgi:hypothetical protein
MACVYYRTLSAVSVPALVISTSCKQWAITFVLAGNSSNALVPRLRIVSYSGGCVKYCSTSNHPSLETLLSLKMTLFWDMAPCGLQ